MDIIAGDGAPVLRSLQGAEIGSITTTDFITTSGTEVSEPFNYYDAILENVVSEGSARSYKIDVIAPAERGTPLFINKTPSVCDVTADGYVTPKNGGGMELVYAKLAGVTFRVSKGISASSTTPVVRFKQYRPGSVGEHVTAAVNALISGLTASDSTQKRWSVYSKNLDAPNVTQNPDLFSGSLDLSPISIMRSSRSDDVFPGLLVTDRHILGAWHVFPGVGEKIVWKAQDGTYKSATVLSRYQFPSSQHADTGIGYLSEPITGITPFKFLPVDVSEHIGSAAVSLSGGVDAYNFGSMPCLYKGMHRKNGSWQSQLSIGYLVGLGGVISQYVTTGPYADWSAPVTGGDSGSPIMILINGELVLLATFYTAGGGVPYNQFASEINTKMRELAAAQGDNTQYALTHVSLAGFTKYVSRS